MRLAGRGHSSATIVGTYPDIDSGGSFSMIITIPGIGMCCQIKEAGVGAIVIQVDGTTTLHNLFYLNYSP